MLSDFKRQIFTASVTLTTCLSAPPPAACAPAQSGLIAPIQTALRAGESGNMTLLHSQYLPNITIVDEVAPFIWSGPTALDDYLKAFGTFFAEEKFRDTKIQTGAAKFFYASSSAAYVTIPITSTSKVNGLRLSESALLVFTLQNTTSGWKIRSQTYAKIQQSFPAKDPYRSGGTN